MDAFHDYDNLLGLFVGNEIIAINNQSLAAPFIKSASRDLKAYRDAKGYRKIPVGYSATDIAELRPYLQDYLTCGGNSSENIDFCKCFGNLPLPSPYSCLKFLRSGPRSQDSAFVGFAYFNIYLV